MRAGTLTDEIVGLALGQVTASWIKDKKVTLDVGISTGQKVTLAAKLDKRSETSQPGGVKDA